MVRLTRVSPIVSDPGPNPRVSDIGVRFASASMTPLPRLSKALSHCNAEHGQLAYPGSEPGRSADCVALRFGNDQTRPLPR
jgi:hypothetical protein